MGPGGKAQRLKPADVPAVYRLLGECGELWADGPSWRTHLCREAASLLGGASATYMELHAGPSGQVRGFDGATITGLGDTERAHFHRAITDFAAGRIEFVGHGHMIGQVVCRGAVVEERVSYASDRTWYQSRYFQEYRRPGGLDHHVLSFRQIEPGWLCIMEVDRPLGEPPLGGRAVKLLELVSAELVARLGSPLVTEQHLGLNGLPPRLEQTLRALLRGNSSKCIAAELGLSVHTVRQYVSDLHRRFGVRSNSEMLAYFLERQPRRVDWTGPGSDPAGSGRDGRI